MTWVLVVTACGPPPSTPPPPDPEVREIEEQKASRDADRVGPLGIPEAQLPSPGECRIWYPQRTASQQPAAQGCVDAEASATPGTWVLYRPPDDARVVHARVMHPEKVGVVIRINIFDAERGTYLGTKEVSEGPP